MKKRLHETNFEPAPAKKSSRACNRPLALGPWHPDRAELPLKIEIEIELVGVIRRRNVHDAKGWKDPRAMQSSSRQTYLNFAISFDSSAARSARLMYGLPAPAAPAFALSLSGDIHGGAGAAFLAAVSVTAAWLW